MSKFFFDTGANNSFDKDHEGQELPTKEAARKAALEALPDMVREHIPEGDNRALFVAVRDDSGAIICKATLTLGGDWLT